MVIYSYHKSKNYGAEDTENLIKKSLQDYEGKQEVSFVLRTKEGKPYVSTEGLFVGVSHTVSLVLVAVAPYDFGIDAERCDRELHNLDKLVEKCCTKEEKESILKANDEEKRKRFLTLWTKKEALLKCWGVGLSGLQTADTYAVSGYFHTLQRGNYIITVYAEEPIQGIKEKNMDGICFE